MPITFPNINIQPIPPVPMANIATDSPDARYRSACRRCYLDRLEFPESAVNPLRLQRQPLPLLPERLGLPLEHLVLLSRSGQLSRVFKLIWAGEQRLQLRNPGLLGHQRGIDLTYPRGQPAGLSAEGPAQLLFRAPRSSGVSLAGSLVGRALLRGVRPRSVVNDTRATLRDFDLFPIQVAVVVARKDSGLAVIDLNDFVSDLPYEGAVVGYEADGATIVAKGVGENLPGGYIQVVGSSMSSRLLRWTSSLARAIRAFSPPDNTDMGLRTSSPLNRKPPRMRRRFWSDSSGAAC